jgi:CobQ/CobB/MinD/ParA nucleotide binding domain protein
MRILLSGGIKTQNIVSGIQKKFKASGDDFIVVEYIDDIEELFGRGEFFDKALVTEQSITKDYSINDEYTIRHRINNFANMMKSKQRKFNYVFLAQTKEMANMIHEEILPILGESAVVLKEPPYTVPFFVSILVTDSKQLPDEIVYTPELTIVNNNIDDNNSEITGDMNIESLGREVKAPDNFDTEVFGVKDGLGDIGEGFNVDNSIHIDTGVDDIGVPIGDIEMPDFDDETDDEPVEEGEEDFSQADVYNPSEKPLLNNKNWGDQSINLEGITPIHQSGELDDHINENPSMTTQDTGYIPGFDDTEENGDEIETQEFMPDDPSVYQSQQEQYIENNQFNGGFEESDQNQMLPGFDTSDYANETYEQDYQNNIDENMYNEQAGFNADDYNQQTEPEQEIEQPQVQMQQPTQQPVQTKKGLLNKIGIGKNNNQQSQLQNNNIQQNPNNSAMMNSLIGIGNVTPDSVKNELKPFAARGNSIVVTGCGGCGTSTVAYSLASIVSQLGYTVLLVDMDTEGRTQNYISKENYDSMEPDGANLMSAVNSSNGINTHISVVRQGFHLLTMGIGTDTAPVNELLHKEKISRFVNLAKTSHNFVIYDIPFASAVGYLSEITYMCDNLVLVTDASNWGVTKTMLNVCNIASDDMQDTVFNRAQFVFNRYRNLYKVLGKKVRTCLDITKVMDQKVAELIGDDPGFHFEDLHIAGIINDDPDIEQGWFEGVQYADTKKGQNIFLELIERIVLKK